ncbi:MAG TPA: amidohydrolase family protein [Flavobacteriales bacterium]|nr:amidohydrolase family protein [Flavobacteriales bacterium]
MNGTAHLGNGEVINNSVIGFKDGKIMLVGNALVVRIDMSKFDTVINIEGKHVYPGFIGCNSTLGLAEIESTRSTLDFNEIGNYNPNTRAQIAYNTDSKIIPTVRANGVLLVQTTPRGGIFSGSSSVMTTSGWNWEDATVKADDGLHMNWPSFAPRRRRNAEPKEEGATENEYAKQYEAIKKYLVEAKAYAQQTKYDPIDVRFESMRGIFNGKQTLYIHANQVKEITDAVLLCRELGIEKKCIVGGYESYLVAGLMKENNVSVMLRRVHDLPLRDDEDVDLPYKLPYLLQKEGILFCIQNEGDQEAANLRNLPFQAATSVAYGLTKEQALQAITQSAAKILGLDKSYGTLEGEKSATLFVSDGDAMDMRTNNVIMAWVNGKKVSLNTHQKDLYKKYTDKYNQK